MAYVGKNPKFNSVIVTDEGGTPDNPPAGATKLITRSGALYTRNSSGTETQVLTGSAAYLYDSDTGNVTITDTDNIATVGIDATSGNLTVTLPTAADNTNRVLTVVKLDSSTNTVTVAGESSETINGATTYVLRTQYSNVTMVCNGTAWILKSPPRNRIQTNTLGATLSSNTTDIAALKFENLTVGKLYKCTMNVNASVLDFDGTPISRYNFIANHNGSQVGQLRLSIDQGIHIHNGSFYFTAAATTLTFDAIFNNLAQFNSSTNCVLEELNNYEVTTAW